MERCTDLIINLQVIKKQALLSSKIYTYMTGHYDILLKVEWFRYFFIIHLGHF